MKNFALTAQKDHIKIIQRYKYLFKFFQETLQPKILNEKEKETLDSVLEIISSLSRSISDSSGAEGLISLWKIQTNRIIEMFLKKFSKAPEDFKSFHDCFYYEDELYKKEINQYKKLIRNPFNEVISPFVTESKLPFKNQALLQDTKIEFLRSLVNVSNKQLGVNFPVNEIESLLNDFSGDQFKAKNTDGSFAKEYNEFCHRYKQNEIDMIDQYIYIRKFSLQLTKFEQRSDEIFSQILQGKKQSIKKKNQEELVQVQEQLEKMRMKLTELLTEFKQLVTTEDSLKFKNSATTQFLVELTDIFSSAEVVINLKKEQRNSGFFSDVKERLSRLSIGAAEEAQFIEEIVLEKKILQPEKNRQRASGMIKGKSEQQLKYQLLEHKIMEQYKKTPKPQWTGVKKIPAEQTSATRFTLAIGERKKEESPSSKDEEDKSEIPSVITPQNN